MSRTLAMHEMVLSTAKSLIRTGSRSKARRLLTNLVESKLISEPIEQQALRLLAQLHFEAEQYSRARQQFLKLVKIQPDDATLHFELGRTFELDPHGCDYRAARRFRIAVRLNPSNALYQVTCARALARIHQDRLASLLIRRLNPVDFCSDEILDIAVETLRILGRPSQALNLVRKQRFEAPNCRKLRKLEQELRYDLAASKFTPRTTRDTRTILPFVTLQGAGGSEVVRQQRRDRPSISRPHIA